MLPVDIVLLRGLGREARHWGSFPGYLSSQEFCNEVHCIDLPGMGKFSEITSPLTISETAEFVATQLPEKSEDRPKVLVAVSLGAMVAVELIKKRPDYFEKAFLMNTSFRNLSTLTERFQWFAFQQFAKILMQIKNPYQREYEVVKMVSRSQDRWQEVAQNWGKIADTYPIKPKNILRQLLAASTYQLPANKLSTAIVVMNSLGDRMVNPKCSQVFSEQWHLPLKTHRWAGHDIIVDDPEWVVQQLASELTGS